MGMSFQWSNFKVKKLPFEKGKVYWDNINLWKAEENNQQKSFKKDNENDNTYPNSL